MTPSKILKRRIAIVAVAAVGGLGALGGAAALAQTTSVHPTAVHAYVARDGTTTVSGYDGGVPVAKP